MISQGTVNYMFVMAIPMLLGAGVIHTYRRFSSAPSIFSSVEIDVRLSLLMISTAIILQTFGMSDDAYYRQILTFVLSLMPSVMWHLIFPIAFSNIKVDSNNLLVYKFLDHFLFTAMVVWSAWVVSKFYFYDYLLLGGLSNAIISLTPVFVSFINKDVEKRVRVLIESQVYTDELTGLGNRKSMYMAYDRLKGNIKNPLMVMVVDIDHFKKFNDHYGHVEGDECLVYVAKTLEDLFAGFNIIRFGGEEFVIFGEMTKEMTEGFNSNKLIQSWKKGEMDLDYEHAASPTGYLSMSGGDGVFSPKTVGVSNAKLLISVADKALYEAKNKRRLLVEASENSL